MHFRKGKCNCKQETDEKEESKEMEQKSCQVLKGAGVTFDLTFFDNSKVIDFDD